VARKGTTGQRCLVTFTQLKSAPTQPKAGAGLGRDADDAIKGGHAFPQPAAVVSPPDKFYIKGSGNLSLCKQLGHVFERFELQCITAWIKQKHCRLFTDLTLEADVRLKDELSPQ